MKCLLLLSILVLTACSAISTDSQSSHENPRCNEKSVLSSRDLMYFGYEYNQENQKCDPVTSGSDGESDAPYFPFDTLEECQNVCE